MTPPPTNPRAIWQELADIARWAPSPHNTQPWKVRPLEATDGALPQADLFMVRARRLPDEDVTGHFLICAMGIFIEALAIAAAARGLRLVSNPVQALDVSLDLIPFAHLSLVVDPEIRIEFDPRVLLERRTSRLHTTARTVPDRDAAHFADTARTGGLRLGIVSDVPTISAILDRNISAVFHDFNIPAYHAEIASWFRYSEASSALRLDGLDARCMNVPPHELFLSARLPALMRWRLSRSMMRAMCHRRLGGATQLGYLAGPFFDRHAAESAGRCLLRVWLAMHERGVTIHPFGNLVTNRDAHDWVSRTLNTNDIWLVFRMGYTAQPPRSHRLGTETLLC